MATSSENSSAAPARLEPPWWRAPRASRRRQPLSREVIVRAAVEIVDTEGVDALTVRRLGEALNTGSATLYWHVGNKDELAEIVYDHVMGEVELPEIEPERWQEQVKEFARQIYHVLLRHNDLARLSIGRIPAGPNLLRIMEWGFDLARQAGMSDRVAGYLGDILGRYIDASVLEVTARGGPSPEMVGEYFTSLPPEQFPNLTAVLPAMFEGSDDDRFEFGLDLLVRGLASYAQAPAGKRRSRR